MFSGFTLGHKVSPRGITCNATSLKAFNQVLGNSSRNSEAEDDTCAGEESAEAGRRDDYEKYGNIYFTWWTFRKFRTES